MKSFFVKYKILSIIVSMMGLFGGTGYVLTLVVQDTAVYKHIDESYQTSLKVDSIQKVNQIRLDHVFDYVKKSEKKKKEEFQVGLRFRVLNEKLYFRDRNREYREIQHDNTGDYYRDDNDKRVYINDKL